MLPNPCNITDQVMQFVPRQDTLGMSKLEWRGEKPQSPTLTKETEEVKG